MIWTPVRRETQHGTRTFLLTIDVAGGRPSPDRSWTECFAQLVGTVLSLWDAKQLDAVGEDGEVVPTFINLADASIKMVRGFKKSFLTFRRSDFAKDRITAH